MSKPPKSRLVGEPIPGRYLTKLVQKGWAVPASIETTADGTAFTATLDGEPLPGEWSRDDIETQLYDWITGEPSHPFLKITLYGQQCTEAEYQHRLAMKHWARQHAPWHPCLHPTRSIDHSTLPAEDF